MLSDELHQESEDTCIASNRMVDNTIICKHANWE